MLVLDQADFLGQGGDSFIKELVNYSAANRGLYVIVLSPEPLWRTFSEALANMAITTLHFRAYT